jgi:hypothetical protein
VVASGEWPTLPAFTNFPFPTLRVPHPLRFLRRVSGHHKSIAPPHCLKLTLEDPASRNLAQQRHLFDSS